MQQNLSFPVLSQTSFFGQHFILEGSVDVVDEIQLTLPEQEELGGLAVVKAHADAFEVRKRCSLFIPFEIMRILFQNEGLAFFPVHEMKGSCSNRVRPE